MLIALTKAENETSNRVRAVLINSSSIIQITHVTAGGSTVHLYGGSYYNVEESMLEILAKEIEAYRVARI